MQDITAEAQQAAGGNVNILAPDVLMVILTWATFFILLVILKKFAFKPILENLQKREDYIRKSLEDADKAKAQLADVEKEKVKILSDAKTQAVAIIDEARKNAVALAHDIENKARISAQDALNNAHTQIDREYVQLKHQLKTDAANMAIQLAGKILKENTDTDKNRRLVAEAVNQL